MGGEMFALKDWDEQECLPGELASKPDGARAGQNGGRSMAVDFDWLWGRGFPKYGPPLSLHCDHGRATHSESAT